jgi:hypothetical protein
MPETKTMSPTRRQFDQRCGGGSGTAGLTMRVRFAMAFPPAPIRTAILSARQCKRHTLPEEQNGDIHALAVLKDQRRAAKRCGLRTFTAICCGITTELENLAIARDSIAQFEAVSG